MQQVCVARTLSAAAAFAALAFGGMLPAGARAAPQEHIVVGAGNTPPLAYWGDGRRPAGFVAAVLTEAARREGVDIEWRRAGSSADIERDLAAGVLDLVPAGIDTPERRKKFFVSKPWWFSELSLIVREGVSPDALRGKRIALGSPIYRFLAAEHFPGSTLGAHYGLRPGTPGATMALCSGQADAALVDTVDVHDFLMNAPETCRGVVKKIFETDLAAQLCVIARPGRRAVAERLRDRIDELTLDGTLAAMASRYPDIAASSAVMLGDLLRDKYNRRLLTIALASVLAMLAVVVAFFVRQERTRRVLARSEARYQSLFDLAATGIAHVDAATRRYLAVNQEFLKITGYSREEILGAGLGFLDLTHPDDRRISIEAYERLAAGEVARYSLEKRYVRKDGAHIWARVDAGGVRSGGKLLYAVVILQDITERRNAEQALSESEQRLRLAIESTELGTFDCNPQTGALVWSDFCKRHFGLPPEAEVDFMAFLACVHPEDRPGVEQRIADAMRPENRGSYAAEFRTIGLQDAGVRWIAATARVFFDAQGRASRFIGVSRDITQRKQAEGALRRALDEAESGRRLLDAMMEYAPMAITIADAPEFKVRKVSRSALQLMGKTETGLPLGQDPALWQMCRSNVAEPAAAGELPLVRAAMNGEVIREEEWVLVRPDGKKVPILCTAAPILDGAGHVTGAVSGWQDITERKQIEWALRESERHFRELADSLPQLVWMTAPGGAVIYCNRQWHTQLGVAEGEPLGERWLDLLHPDDREAGATCWQRSLAEETVCRAEVRLRVADGSYRWFLGRAVPVPDAEGRMIRWFGTWTDIDESRRAEERLRQAQKLESVALLAGGIAHDFNNLLTGILGNASLLVEEASPRTAGRLSNIIGGAERAADLTRQLLAYAGKGQFYTTELDLSAAVRNTAELVRASVPGTVELKFDLAEGLPAVKMDPSQAQQIFMNLVVNAGEAIGEGNAGAISIATGWSEISQPFASAIGDEAPAGRYVWIEVADSGPGMDEGTMAKIFDPFFTTKFTGRGLGLAAVSGIVRSRGGAVTVESTPGCGCRFRAYFPAAAGEQEEAPKALQSARGTILVVDDEAYVREFLTAAVSRSGYRALAAGDCAEALSICEKEMEHLDALIFDVSTHAAGGSEVLRKIRAHRPHVKVLLTSGYSESEARERCGGCQCSGFIQKPYSAQELYQRLDALLG